MSENSPVILSEEEAARYRGWLSDALTRAESYLGTEVEDFLEPLLAMDQFIRARNDNKQGTLELEKEFARAAGYAEPDKAAFNAVLDFAAASFNRRMAEQGTDMEGMLALLEQAGAKILRGGKDFIPTDPKRLASPIIGENEYKVVLQPRLSWVVQGLRQIGVYPEDMVIHLRDKDPNKVRQMSHALIEIPRLGGKQIAVNNQKGEVTFVSQNRYELSVWEKLTKYQLKHVPGITPVVLRDKDMWLNRILALVQEDGVTPAKKVNLDKDIASPKRQKMQYSVALIVESLKATHDMTGGYPSSGRLIEHGPLADGIRTWRSVDGAMKIIWLEKEQRLSCNGLTRENCAYKSLADLKDKLGLNDNYTLADIIDSLHATYEATKEYPSPLWELIEHGPLANGKRTWGSVNVAMAIIWRDKNPPPDCNGLTRKNCPDKNLTALKDRLGMNSDYTVANIIDSLKATHDVTGEYPSAIGGLIEHGPLADGKRTWRSVDAAMKIIWLEKNPSAHCNGLTRKNCPYKSLADLKDQFGLNDNYTLVDIIDSLKATYVATGVYPAAGFGIIEYGPLANGKRTWISVDQSMSTIWDEKNLFQSMNGLTRKNCDCKSLAEVKQKYIFGAAPLSPAAAPA